MCRRRVTRAGAYPHPLWLACSYHHVSIGALARGDLQDASAPVLQPVGGLAGQGWNVLSGKPETVVGRIENSPGVVAPAGGRRRIGAGAACRDVDRAEVGLARSEQRVGGTGEKCRAGDGKDHAGITGCVNLDGGIEEVVARRAEIALGGDGRAADGLPLQMGNDLEPGQRRDRGGPEGGIQRAPKRAIDELRLLHTVVTRVEQAAAALLDSARWYAVRLRGDDDARERGQAAGRHGIAIGHGPDTQVGVAGAVGIERAEEILGVRGASRDGGLHRCGLSAANGEVGEVDVVDAGMLGDEVGLGDGVDLRAVELWAEDGELVGADVDVLSVNAQQRLVAKAGAAGVVGLAVGAVVGGEDLVVRPRLGRVASGVHGEIGMRGGAVLVEEEDDREPGVGGRIEVAPGVAGELDVALGIEHIDVEGAGDDRAVGSIDGEGGVDRLDDEAVADAEALIGWLKLQTEVGHRAVVAADAVEVAYERARLCGDGGRRAAAAERGRDPGVGMARARASGTRAARELGTSGGVLRRGRGRGGVEHTGDSHGSERASSGAIGGRVGGMRGPGGDEGTSGGDSGKRHRRGQAQGDSTRGQSGGKTHRGASLAVNGTRQGAHTKRPRQHKSLRESGAR